MGPDLTAHDDQTAGRDVPPPDRLVRSPDGTRIAVFRSGLPGGPPLILVHGTTADHTAFRAVAPRLGRRFALHAVDRRGRGASGDATAYSIEREFDDIAAVVDAVAAEAGRSVDAVGHSFGGRCALGAALRTPYLRRLVVYEGAPAPPGIRYALEGLATLLRARLEAGDPDGALETFLRAVVGMDDAAIAAYRANPTWPIRVAAAGTILREIEAEGSAAAGLDALAAVRNPVLQLLGSASLSVFRQATEALHARLVGGRIVVIEGAAHAAHHTHVDAFVGAVESFLA